MAEREQPDPYETPGTANPGNPYAPPSSPAPSGFEWRWVPSVGQWQLVRTATPATTTTNTLASLTREQRDVLRRGTAGNLEGFMNRASYGNDLKARNSVKNTFATIASRYPSKPSSIDLILADPDFKQVFPNAKRVGVDSIDFGGVKSDFESGTPVGVIDVLTAADASNDTARGWWWGFGGTPSPQTAAPPSPSPAPSFAGMTGATATTEEGQTPLPTDYTPFTGEYASLTPEEIYRRNAGDAARVFGTPSNPGWNSNPLFSNPAAAGQFQGAPGTPGAMQTAGLFATGLAAPAMTLASLGRGIKNVFSVPKGRRVPGRL